MKKPDIRVIIGVSIALILAICLVVGLNIKTNSSNHLVQNTETSTIDETQSQSETQESEISETEDIVSEVESEEESESETQEKPQNNNQQAVAPKPANTPYYIRVNRLANCVTVYKKDADGNYSVPVKAMICSVGLTDATPLGTYKIYARYQWRPLFGGVYGQYAVRFYGSYLFHSVPYTRQTKDSLKEGQFNMLGEPASQGCVRLSVVDSKWIYDNCVNGTPVEVYDSPDPGPLGRPEAYKISENSPYKGWDPTDPDPANPWNKGVVSINGVSDITVNKGETVDLMNGVSATDVDGLPLEVTIEGNVDWNTPGKYEVKYNATSVLKTTETVTAIVTVNGEVPPENSETPVNPVPPANPETPVNPVPPENSETPVNPNPPANPETPENPDSPANSETPGNSGPPGNSETPGNSGPPGNSETPGNSGPPASSETPGNSDPPTNPADQTQPAGAETPSESQSLESEENLIN